MIFKPHFLHKLIERDFMSGIRQLSLNEIELVSSGTQMVKMLVNAATMVGVLTTVLRLMVFSLTMQRLVMDY